MLRTVTILSPYVTHCYISSLKRSILNGKSFMWKESMYWYLKVITMGIHCRLCSKEKIGNDCKNVTYGFGTVSPYVTHLHLYHGEVCPARDNFYVESKYV